jgi:hypothetical protein
MSTDSDASSVSRRQFLAVASGAAAAGSMSVGNVLASPPPPSTPNPPTNYLVTVDVTTRPISYTIPGPSPTAPRKRVYRLKVSSNDTVTWEAKTNGPKHRVTVLFLKETPLIDTGNNNQPLYAVHGSESQPALAGKVDADASGIFEYSVAVFDDNAGGLTYTDDPKIIVGSGNSITLTDVLQEVEALKPTSSDQKKIVEDIEGKLHRLIEDSK